MRLNLLISCLLHLITTAKLYAGIADTTQIPILAWGGVPPHEAGIARYEEMKNAGLTVSLTRSTSIDSMAMMLDMAAKAGVQLIVRCPELQTDPENTVKRFMNHPATAGYFLKDEPSASEFEALGIWAGRIRAIDSQRFSYLNLLPNYAVPAQLGTASYQQHVSVYLKSVPVPFLSFDHYPVIEDNGQRSLRKEWFENLEIIAGESKKANKPFWAFALSVAHGNYPVPTLGELRLQVFANLAYGAQGIQYFTYWTPKNKSQYNYHHGPIDDDNKRTDVYEMISTVNREIQNLSGVFLSAKVISVAHIGKNIPVGTQRLPKLPEGIKKISIQGEGAIVSVLEKGNDRFIVIVNKDFVNPMKLKIKSNSTLEKVSKNGTILNTHKHSSSVAIGAGDIAVYRLNHINESSLK
ncbi:beta-galactosidase [Agriterribacter sp.]|uniref:beta-galactosidase n=1 Tax=Agriterribacter sp. TaxID=2821509 RepID=UPI002B591F8D|nr:beta-galactosidase [Agriterribacter sp.]HRO45238.1 beta-galactosidase [Agriterribacter sp.]HRQ16841.1 beta-galactosidase [Agriterribacter sp.]